MKIPPINPEMKEHFKSAFPKKITKNKPLPYPAILGAICGHIVCPFVGPLHDLIDVCIGKYSSDEDTTQYFLIWLLSLQNELTDISNGDFSLASFLENSELDACSKNWKQHPVHLWAKGYKRLMDIRMPQLDLTFKEAEVSYAKASEVFLLYSSPAKLSARWSEVLMNAGTKDSSASLVKRLVTEMEANLNQLSSLAMELDDVLNGDNNQNIKELEEFFNSQEFDLDDFDDTDEFEKDLNDRLSDPHSDLLEVDSQLQLELKKLGGQKYLKKNKGHFWGIRKTRRYMQLLEEKAMIQASISPHEAVENFLLMLELNPTDNQGAREHLAAVCLKLNNYEILENLFKQFPNDILAGMQFAEVIFYYKTGDSRQANQLKTELNKRWNHSLSDLLNNYERFMTLLEKNIGNSSYLVNSEEECVYCLDLFEDVLEKTPGLIQWLAKSENKSKKKKTKKRR
jgi:hypothetical protein